MARAGIPAFSVAAGMKIKGKAKDFASKAIKEFNDMAYHSPRDELKPDWDFSGFVVLILLGPANTGFILDMQRKLYLWSRNEPHRVFSDLFNLVSSTARMLKFSLAESSRRLGIAYVQPASIQPGSWNEP